MAAWWLESVPHRSRVPRCTWQCCSWADVTSSRWPPAADEDGLLATATAWRQWLWRHGEMTSDTTERASIGRCSIHVAIVDTAAAAAAVDDDDEGVYGHQVSECPSISPESNWAQERSPYRPDPRYRCWCYRCLHYCY